MFAHDNIEYNHNASESKLFSDVGFGNERVASDWLLQGPPIRKAEVKLAVNFSHPAVTAEDRSLVGQTCTLSKAAKSVISREWLCHSKEESSWLPEQEEVHSKENTIGRQQE